MWLPAIIRNKNTKNGIKDKSNLKCCFDINVLMYDLILNSHM